MFLEPCALKDMKFFEQTFSEVSIIWNSYGIYPSVDNKDFPNLSIHHLNAGIYHFIFLKILLNVLVYWAPAMCYVFWHWSYTLLLAFVNNVPNII